MNFESLTMDAIFSMDTIGWIGSILFAICGLPQAIHSYKNKHSDGLTWSFIMMWFWGEIFTLIYVFPKNDVTPLFTNYVLNLLFLIIIIWYKFFPKRKPVEILYSTNN